MKRFFAFKGSIYYPEGGMHDFIGDFDNIESALRSIIDSYVKEFEPVAVNYESIEIFLKEKRSMNFEQIYDSHTRMYVFEH
ncbi:hypothetical protein FAZ19_19755 [Sphingobacterium alkalisoli]|uniref:Uncharacterized protein n=1 Tax=Sphingobacterium alkalisoli TaxID=1874115 RepID=A0A4U0GUX2_9SPHI|nr:hypothetical protein [Sphingobacterium alkalisoli]TJY62706.1 hypothetical protein FAZ19_19755 [Sphingobacterium alkalisoli]GGH28334.1 hypothetical protein GCM10011418_38920 [Sphingobacterium alkalisoli]